MLPFNIILHKRLKNCHLSSNNCQKDEDTKVGGHSLPISVWAMIFAGLFVGWGIGANDAANSMGTAVGAGVRSVNQAVFLVAGFGIAGALLLGGKVIHTVGYGVFPIGQISPEYRHLFVLAVSIGAGITVTVSTWFQIPTSTSHAIIGGIIGSGIALGGASLVNSRIILRIALGWLITPVSGALLSYIFLRLGQKLCAAFPQMRPTKRLMGTLLTVSGCFMAFSWGANDVANAVGPLVGTGLISPVIGTLIGGMAMGLGVITWGPRVMETVGERITKLVPTSALAAETAAAINILIYTLCGLPASSSHTIVGTVAGAGLAKGKQHVNFRVLGEIFLAWLVTPLAGAAVGFCLFRLFQLLRALAV